MIRIAVQLSGGVGNQMFQYAAARALADHHAAEMVLDTQSGFIRDRLYRRRYELDSFPISARHGTLVETIPVWLYRIENRLFGKAPKSFDRRPYGLFINETRFEFSDAGFEYNLTRSCWLTGYWQSPKYFSGCEELILKELYPAAPLIDRFQRLGAEMRSCDSVALGVRLYEESSNPAAHAKDGKVKTMADINRAIEALSAQAPSSRFFVFCTQRSALLAELHLPVNTTFVTHDDGFEGTLPRLWLLAQCKHHIMNNSSFYWWGAWLSRKVHRPESQIIYAADNFINQDALLNHWTRF